LAFLLVSLLLSGARKKLWREDRVSSNPYRFDKWRPEIDAYVEELPARMILEERDGQMVQISVRDLVWENDVIHGYRTIFAGGLEGAFRVLG
jgi:hypothetical protein